MQNSEAEVNEPGNTIGRTATADLLGHRNIDTTSFYVKVAVSQLADVALPFPGGASCARSRAWWPLALRTIQSHPRLEHRGMITSGLPHGLRSSGYVVARSEIHLYPCPKSRSHLSRWRSGKYRKLCRVFASTNMYSKIRFVVPLCVQGRVRSFFHMITSRRTQPTSLSFAARSNGSANTSWSRRNVSIIIQRDPSFFVARNMSPKTVARSER